MLVGCPAMDEDAQPSAKFPENMALNRGELRIKTSDEHCTVRWDQPKRSWRSRQSARVAFISLVLLTDAAVIVQSSQDLDRDVGVTKKLNVEMKQNTRKTFTLGRFRTRDRTSVGM